MEIIRTVLPHFVIIDGNIRLPLVKLRDPTAWARMLDNQPLSVQVEPVVVGPSAGPKGVVKAMTWIRNRHIAAMHMVPCGHATITIGIEYCY